MLSKAGLFLESQCRKLEFARYSFLFGSGSTQTVIEELIPFQNEDGGFGRGLEPDFELPLSSPMATSVGLQICDEAAIPPNNDVVGKAIQFLYGSYKEAISGWISTPKEVNDFPHAPWWHFDEKKQEQVQFEQWGNPSAENIGWLLKYRDVEERPVLSSMVEKASGYILEHNSPCEPHELYCLLKFYKYSISSGLISFKRASELQKKLRKLVSDTVCRDPDKWNQYVPQPIDFVTTPSSYLLSDLSEAVEQNLVFLVDSVTDDGIWTLTWKWDSYPEQWQKAERNWIGVLAIKNLKILKAFDRIETPISQG